MLYYVYIDILTHMMVNLQVEIVRICIHVWMAEPEPLHQINLKTSTSFISQNFSDILAMILTKCFIQKFFWLSEN